ncbi:alpha/beta fold hydrolase [Burkholderia cenocepacia]|uniref:alpha/beta fold hydrolase n=1 Tax=Burkholderia cenocepacia TaxID=95486 RepID=UPI002856A567|nr:alpha/beta hydrolase [Burkholderia cenocepacia]MDR8071906.1 alpha/beta hydrolase [Burkholderia cenocepacia]
MRKITVKTILSLSVALLPASVAFAAPALEVLGKDYVFPNKIAGLPERLSDFKDLQINYFKTNDGVRLAYWEAGSGKPLIFIPGASANGAEYINVMYLLSKNYHVYVLDPRNHGLSQKVSYGMRISRFAMDLRELNAHLGIKSADYCGWSMGASVLWNYIDLFGTSGIDKAVFIDEPISIYAHSDWSKKERLDASAITTSAEDFVASFTGSAPITNPILNQLIARFKAKDSPYYVNSESFANEFVNTDYKYISLFMFDHIKNDWRDVIRSKIDIPVAIFTGEYSYNVDGQRWMQSVIPNSTLYVYSKEEQGDHFLHFKNPIKFTQDLREFLEK